MSQNPIDILQERGFIQQVTHLEELHALFQRETVTVYLGYDPTASSLHVGNLLTLIALKHIENAGHRVIALLGGATAKIGDPSGKTEMRPMLEHDLVDANRYNIEQQISRILNTQAGTTRIVNNADWLMKWGYIDFLREVGRHFSVNRMLSAESYRARMERGLSFIELNYQILQAFDFLHLHRTYGCSLQMGGDDQWGNILAGVDLCRRVDAKSVYGLTFPLLTTASGQKMGKTASGAVWLSAEKLSVFDFYQYWVNTEDADVLRMLGFFTFLPMSEIKACAHFEGAELNILKNILAYEVTALVHGHEQAAQAHAAAQGAFAARTLDAHILPSSRIPRHPSQDAAASIPALTLSFSDLNIGLAIVDAMLQCSLSSSKNEARRLIAQGGVSLGEIKITDPNYVIGLSDFGEHSDILLRVGKKKVHRLSLQK